MPFKHRVLAVVRCIPRGKTMTYKEVAAAAGSPRAFRAVGSFMKANRDAGVPCHRVVRSDRRPGEYNRSGGEKTKIRLLAGEGVRIEGGVIRRGSAVRRHAPLESRRMHEIDRGLQ